MMAYALCVFLVVNAVTVIWCVVSIFRIIKEANKIIEGEEFDAE